MSNLNIADGRKRFTINGDENRAFYVNLTDNQIAVRAKKALAFIKSMEADQYLTDENTDEIDAIEKNNDDLRAQIDYVFAEGVSQAVFGNISPTAVVDTKTKKTFFEAFLEAIMPEIEKEQKLMKKSMEESEKRIQKYTNKYRK